MDNPRLARLFFAFTSAVVTFGLALQLSVSATNDEGFFEAVPARIVNMLSYFTVQSNILVAVTTGLLAVRLQRSATWFRVLRLTAVIAITITGVVYHVALEGLLELSERAARADWLLHTASPLLCVAGWLAFGPRGWVSGRVVQFSIVFPLLWLAYALIRGAIVEDRNGRPFYPYPFLDVFEKGYAMVFVSVALVAALFLALAAGALAADKRLPGVRTG